jgi:hypothetical protein
MQGDEKIQNDSSTDDRCRMIKPDKELQEFTSKVVAIKSQMYPSPSAMPVEDDWKRKNDTQFQMGTTPADDDSEIRNDSTLIDPVVNGKGKTYEKHQIQIEWHTMNGTRREDKVKDSSSKGMQTNRSSKLQPSETETNRTTFVHRTVDEMQPENTSCRSSVKPPVPPKPPSLCRASLERSPVVLASPPTTFSNDHRTPETAAPFAKAPIQKPPRRRLPPKLMDGTGHAGEVITPETIAEKPKPLTLTPKPKLVNVETQVTPTGIRDKPKPLTPKPKLVHAVDLQLPRQARGNGRVSAIVRCNGLQRAAAPSLTANEMRHALSMPNLANGLGSHDEA